MSFLFSLKPQHFSEYSYIVHVFLHLPESIQSAGVGFRLRIHTVSSEGIGNDAGGGGETGYGWGPGHNLGGYFLMNWVVVKSGQDAFR